MADHLGRGGLVDLPEKAHVACGVEHGHCGWHGTAPRVRGPEQGFFGKSHPVLGAAQHIGAEAAASELRQQLQHVAS